MIQFASADCDVLAKWRCGSSAHFCWLGFAFAVWSCWLDSASGSGFADLSGLVLPAPFCYLALLALFFALIHLMHRMRMAYSPHMICGLVIKSGNTKYNEGMIVLSSLIFVVQEIFVYSERGVCPGFPM